MMAPAVHARTGVRPLWVGLLAVVAFVCAILVPLAGPAPAASAASAADWDPGYIIDDGAFYDSNAMTASDVQSFLDAHGPRCASGYTCLKGYGQATGNIAGDRYCDGYRGGSWQTAAQIIDAVARSCGVSQRVLLVLLQKEQGLVTDDAPGPRAYSAAMGQGCPDTAPCDPQFSGFFYQVYYAARQFEVYRLNPTLFGYRAGRNNNILYNPDAGCGTRTVYIQNQATAGLYIYTPYTPNAAALGNLYGEGDGCSSYGNRNFWRLFTDWFGDPRTYTVMDGFAAYYNSRGGASGVIGSAVSYGVFVDQNGQGWYQRFSGGTLYGSYQGGTVFVPRGAILDEYNRNGGPTGPAGWPNAEQTCPSTGKCSQSFVSAAASSTPRYGAHLLWGGVRDYWQRTGALGGSLGAALNDMTYSVPAAGPGWVQNFEAGILVQSAAGFVLVPYSSTQVVWSSNGAGEGRFGWPTAARTCTSAGCAQAFTGGVITAHATYGAHGVDGSFADQWNSRGGLSGLGPALNDMRSDSANGGGWTQNFTAGILAMPRGGSPQLVPYGEVQRVWTEQGAQRGDLGWPLAATECDGSACAQSFGGATVSTSSWGTYTTFGSIATTWRGAGGVGGYGVAINPIRFGTSGGGAWSQHYMKGVLTQRVGGQPVFSPYGPIIDMWYHYGAEDTWLGWPTENAQCDANGCTQMFQNGVARSNAGGVSFSRP